MSMIKQLSLSDVDYKQNLLSFLEYLNGPTWITIPGKDPSRTRILTTLLHGNEPSGIRALYSWLPQAPQPATNIACFIGSVATALQPPPFSFRFLPDNPDLNRAFKPPFDHPIKQIAKNLMALIEQSKPETLIDLHNTSGSSLGFAIALEDTDKHAALSTLFTERLILADIKLGSLMEYASQVCTCVTIECGGIDDEASDIVAMEGIKRYWQMDEILDKVHGQRLEKIYYPLRLELSDYASIGYSSSKVPDWDVTLKLDVEKYNYKILPQDKRIAWLGNDGLRPLQIMDKDQKNVIDQYFYCDGYELKAKQPLKLFMVTSNPNIAKADCLFYLVAHTQWEVSTTL